MGFKDCSGNPEQVKSRPQYSSYNSLHPDTPAKHPAYISPLKCNRALLIRTNPGSGGTKNKLKRSCKMKTKKIVQTLGLAAVMAFSASAFAYGNEDYRPGFNGPAFNSHPAFQESLRLMNEVNERQDKQLDRILNGFYEKRINPHEFRKLMDEQREIRQLENRFLADGFLNRFEYQKLDAALDAASRNIFQEKHDAQGRPGYGGWNSGYGYGNWNR
jgi:hypothetical protein